MNLVLQNSKDIKEVRQFIKGLHYVYDSIAKKDKKVYLYISPLYIALVNDFTESLLNDYKVCLCVFRKNMFRLENVQLDTENFGLLYRIDADLVIKFLNSHVEPEITQVIISVPHPDAGASYMRITYDSGEGVLGVMKMITQYEHIEWIFGDGRINEACLKDSAISSLFSFPPKFPKTIDYAKKYPDIWASLETDGIKIKKTEGDQVIKDHFIRKEEFPHYNFIATSEFLRANTHLCVRTAPLFHHLELANRENKKTEAKLCLLSSVMDESMEKCFLLLETVGEKREIYELYQISARKSIEFQGYVEEPKRIQNKMMPNRVTKKEEGEEERTIFNRFYGKTYDEQFKNDMAIREGIISQAAPKGEEMDDHTKNRKYKIELNDIDD